MAKSVQELVIAVDGPAGAGKSTVARRIAQELQITYLDTGALYRGIAWLAQQEGLDPQAQLSQIAERARQSSFRFEDLSQRIFLNEQEITEEIRTPEITQLASQLSADRGIREALLDIQRRLGQAGGVILDGRDIGTVVFPQAGVKFFLVASAEERARRRHLQQQESQIQQSYAEVLADIQQRDYADYNREVAPLRQAREAILVDTDGLGLEAVVNKMLAAIYAKAS